MELTKQQRDNMLQALRGISEILRRMPEPYEFDIRIAWLIDEVQRGSLSQQTAEVARDLVHEIGHATRPGLIVGSEPITEVATLLGVGFAIAETLNATGSSLPAATWLERLRNISARVCRVKLNNAPPGTGFLVAPDIVMTNSHVVRAVISGHLHPSNVEFQFEPLRAFNGLRRRGAVHRLAAKDWRVAWSPDCPADGEAEPKPFRATIGEFYYALLRLNGAPGDERGFISIRPGAHPFTRGDALHIVQYPNVALVHAGIQSNSILGVSSSKTRVTYRTNAKGGSSGAPCFDKDWNLVAIHHGADPSFNGAYNEGIPIETIRDNLPVDVRAALGSTRGAIEKSSASDGSE